MCQTNGPEGDENNAEAEALLTIIKGLAAKIDMSTHIDIAQDLAIVHRREEEKSEEDANTLFQCPGLGHGRPDMRVSVENDINDTGPVLRLCHLQKLMKIGNTRRGRARNVAIEVVAVVRGGSGKKRRKRRRYIIYRSCLTIH